MGFGIHPDRVTAAARSRAMVGDSFCLALNEEGTSLMSDRNLVLAFFPDEAAADDAAEALKESGAKGDAIGILVLDDDGKLKQEKVGARSTGKGAAIGGVLFLLGPAAVGVGVLGGAAAGALHHKALGLSDADKERVAGELTGGKAAVGVLADFEAGPAISQRLTDLGGTTESYEVTDEALEAAASDAPEA